MNRAILTSLQPLNDRGEPSEFSERSTQSLDAGKIFPDFLQRAIKAHQNALRAIHEINLALNPEDLVDALKDVQSLIDVAENLVCQVVTGSKIDDFVIFNFQKTVANSLPSKAVQWATLAHRGHCKMLFKESVIHLVGLWRTLPRKGNLADSSKGSNQTDQLGIDDLPKPVRALCQKKYDELIKTKRAIDWRIGSHYPDRLIPSFPSLNVGPGSQTTRNQGEPTTKEVYSKQVMSWMALSLYRHWVSSWLADGKPNEDEMYKRMSRAGEAYIPYKSIEEFTKRFPMSGKSRKKLETELAYIKDDIKPFVAELVKKECMFPPEHEVSYLLCTKVLQKEIPFEQSRPFKGPGFGGDAISQTKVGGSEFTRMTRDEDVGVRLKPHTVQFPDVVDGKLERRAANKRARENQTDPAQLASSFDGSQVDPGQLFDSSPGAKDTFMVSQPCKLSLLGRKLKLICRYFTVTPKVAEEAVSEVVSASSPKPSTQVSQSKEVGFTRKFTISIALSSSETNRSRCVQKRKAPREQPGPSPVKKQARISEAVEILDSDSKSRPGRSATDSKPLSKIVAGFPGPVKPRKQAESPQTVPKSKSKAQEHPYEILSEYNAAMQDLAQHGEISSLDVQETPYKSNYSAKALFEKIAAKDKARKSVARPAQLSSNVTTEPMDISDDKAKKGDAGKPIPLRLLRAQSCDYPRTPMLTRKRLADMFDYLQGSGKKGDDNNEHTELGSTKSKARHIREPVPPSASLKSNRRHGVDPGKSLRTQLGESDVDDVCTDSDDDTAPKSSKPRVRVPPTPKADDFMAKFNKTFDEEHNDGKKKEETMKPFEPDSESSSDSSEDDSDVEMADQKDGDAKESSPTPYTGLVKLSTTPWPALFD